MRISRANADDAAGLGSLLWLNHFDQEPTDASTMASRAAFGVEFADWWAVNLDSHHAFIASLDRPASLDRLAPLDRPDIIGMAWVAIVPRVPRPGAMRRLHADIQSVFVQREFRGQGIGSALVEAASDDAVQLGALRVTVHSGRRAVPVYERLGFESSRQLLQRPPDDAPSASFPG